MWRNEMEIEEMCNLARREPPHVQAYAQILADWVRAINRNSDGWCYWRAGSRAADKLSDLLNEATSREWGAQVKKRTPAEAEFKAALRPMKACATKHKIPQPLIGANVAGGVL